MQGRLCIKYHTRTTIECRNVSTNASRGGSTPPTPLDRVLEKAAGKLRLAHPSAQTTKKEEDQNSQTRANQQRRKQSPTAPIARQTRPKEQGKPVDPVDDETLFQSITERDRDSVWDAIRLEVEGDTSDWDEDGTDRTLSASPPSKRRAAPASARDDGPSQPIASSSGFTGFGAPPRRPEPAQPAATSSPGTRGLVSPSPSASALPKQQPKQPKSQPQAQRQQEKQQPRASGRPSPLRVFLFNTEEARTRSLLQQLGWANRVTVVSELRGADLILAAKLAKTGKHVNLTQGERTAANAGIPFVVVGRNMSEDNLRAALEPLLDLSPEEAAAVVAARAATKQAPSAADLRAHRFRVADDFGELLRAGRNV